MRARTCAPLKCVSTTMSAKIAPDNPTAHVRSAAAPSVSLHVSDQSSSCAVQTQVTWHMNLHSTYQTNAPYMPHRTHKKPAWVSTFYKRWPNP